MDKIIASKVCNNRECDEKVLLQNHPEREVFFNGWEIFNSNFERMIKENKAMLLCKWGYLTCVVAVMFVFAAITSNGLNERGLITAGCSFLYLLIMMGLIVRAGFKAKKNNCIIIRLKVLSRSVSRSYRRYN